MYLRKANFVASVFEFKEKYSTEMLEEFIEYWIEMSVNGRKMRFEKQKFFSMGRRLATWERNNKKWKNKKNVSAATLIQRKYNLL